MGMLNLINLVILGLFCSGVSARPGQLNQQKYEFQEYHSTSSQAQTVSSSHNARLQVASVQQEATPWSQQHPNEVNAFAEMFRQNYNQMVAQHNTMMQMHQQTMHNMFVPVTYELYHVPVGYTWNSYFGNQQQFVYDETARMSRQLIEDLEKGRRTQQELLNPNFFIEQAASELNRVHQQYQATEDGDAQDVNHEQTYQQQLQPIFVEPIHQTELEHADHAVVYNDKTNQYEYVKLLNGPGVPPHEELAGPTNAKHTSYIQSLQPVTFQNEKLDRFDQQIRQIEVHTPISVEMPRPVLELPLNYQNAQINKDEFYGSTYDQQPKFDLQYVESQSTAATPSRSNVMSLVRNRSIKSKTSTAQPTTTIVITTTTPLPTTTSGIMSMLPNKRPVVNYTEIYQQVRAELDRQVKLMPHNKPEETHFMGMTSNGDHVKLTYETVNHGKDEKESRGDQGIEGDDYIYEEATESEPGKGTYSLATEPILPQQSSTTSTITPNTSIPVHMNPFYSASIAPFPTTTTTLKTINPYYSAPLAPFPGETLQERSDAQNLQYAEFSEVSDMNQQVQTMDYYYGTHYAEADAIQDLNDNAEFNQGQFQVSGYVDMQQFEDVHQRYTGVGDTLDIGQLVQHPVTQKYEKQLPPEQAYRNPDLQHTSVKNVQQEYEIPAHVQEVTVTPASVDIPNPKRNWFQRQFDKLKNVIH